VTGGSGGIGKATAAGLAREVLDTYPRLDVLVDNVGGFWATAWAAPT
jgi:NAD(P)-dependent dehydrogenase (short-subunit alcohol dehydrogenase family)